MTRIELLESKLAEVNKSLDEVHEDISRLEKLPHSLDLVHRRRDLQGLMIRKDSLEMQLRVAQDHAGITNPID